MRPLAALLAGAAFAEGTPVAIARVDRLGAIEEAVAGRWPDGAPVTADDRFYAASLSKQVTGAAIAVLVRNGQLDPDAPVSGFVHDLPEWATRVTVRHLLHHTAGLWPAGEAAAITGAGDWTDDVVFSALRKLHELSSEPGAAHKYSNVGYVLVAHVVRAVSGQPLSTFAEEHVFRPLGVDGLGFGGADISSFSQQVLLGPKKPLTHGDGGLWSTARGFAAWLHAQNADRLGIAPLVSAPGRLNDGSPVAYGWGIAPRYHRGGPILLHGGGWTGALALAVRSPNLGVSVVAFATAGTHEMLNGLIIGALDDATL